MSYWNDPVLADGASRKFGGGEYVNTLVKAMDLFQNAGWWHDRYLNPPAPTRMGRSLGGGLSPNFASTTWSGPVFPHNPRSLASLVIQEWAWGGGTENSIRKHLDLELNNGDPNDVYNGSFTPAELDTALSIANALPGTHYQYDQPAWVCRLNPRAYMSYHQDIDYPITLPVVFFFHGKPLAIDNSVEPLWHWNLLTGDFDLGLNLSGAPLSNTFGQSIQIHFGTQQPEFQLSDPEGRENLLSFGERSYYYVVPAEVWRPIYDSPNGPNQLFEWAMTFGNIYNYYFVPENTPPLPAPSQGFIDTMKQVSDGLVAWGQKWSFDGLHAHSIPLNPDRPANILAYEFPSPCLGYTDADLTILFTNYFEKVARAKLMSLQDPVMDTGLRWLNTRLVKIGNDKGRLSQADADAVTNGIKSLEWLK